MQRPSRIAITALLLAPLAHSQSTPNRLTFEVASVRPSQATDLNGGIKALPAGQGYTAQNVPVKLMIALMYKIPMRQIKGGPDWLNSDRYNVEARANHAYNLDDLHTMFQSLLADEFKLKFHKESKDGPVYALTVENAKSGSKMKVNDGPQDFIIPMTFGPGGISVGHRVNLEYLCWWLGQVLQQDERPVIDKTGLTQNYDFNLTFTPILPPGVSRDSLSAELQDRPSIFDALRDQLGLELKPQRGPVEFMVIDHVERPVMN